MTKKQTPITDILFEKPFIKCRAERLCGNLGISTAEQLSRYSRKQIERSDFRGTDGRKTLDYLERCLTNAGLSFKELTSVYLGNCGFKIIGKENVRGYILMAMEEIDGPASMTGIGKRASRLLYDLIYSHLFSKKHFVESEGGYGPSTPDLVERFTNGAFRPKWTKPLFAELLKERRIIETYEGYSLPVDPYPLDE